MRKLMNLSNIKLCNESFKRLILSSLSLESNLQNYFKLKFEIKLQCIN